MRHAETTPKLHVAQFSLFVMFAIYCLLWGVTLHLGRLFEVTFSSIGLIVNIISLIVLLAYGYHCHLARRKDFNNQQFLFFGFSGPILGLACMAGIVRLLHSANSSDTLQNTIGAAHHSFFPKEPLSFEMTGHVGNEANVTYFISHATEYISGYLAHLTGLHIVTVSYHILPALVTALGVLSLYMLMMAFGFSQKRSFFLTLIAIILLSLNLGYGYFGEWSLRRSETTRSYFNVFILNILVLLFAIRYHHKAIISNISIFLFIFGVCFTSKSTPFLIIASTSLMWMACFCQHLFLRRALALPCWDLFVVIISAASILPIYSSQFLTADVYQYQLLAWDHRGLSGSYASFTEHLNKVFGQNCYMLVLLVFGVIRHGAAIVRNQPTQIISQEQSSFLFFYSALYLIVVCNPIVFFIYKELTPTYVVYFRFFYSLPLIFYCIILLAAYTPLGNVQFSLDLKTLRQLRVLGILMLLFIIFGVKDSKKVISSSQFKSAYSQQKPEIDSTELKTASFATNIDTTLFAYRDQSFRHGVYNPEFPLLVSKNQFLPLYRSLEDSILIDKAQHALAGNSRLKETHLIALHEVLAKFKPALVIANVASLNNKRFIEIMSDHSYIQTLIKNKDVLYQRKP